MKLFIQTFTTIACSLIFAGDTLAASDTGTPVDVSVYANREILPDFTPKNTEQCANVPYSLEPIPGKPNLYRHTNGAGLAVHSGLVLVTREGALVVDAGMTCSSVWLNKEIQKRFNVPVRYMIYTHAHADHILGANVFKDAGATIIANQRAIEPIVGEKIDVPIPDRTFDKEMKIKLGDEIVELYRVDSSHSDSMTMVYFPNQKALQCTDVCQNKTMPYNDFLDFYYPGWIDTLDWVAKKDIDFIDIGHYTPATKVEQAALRNYLVNLHQQVLDLTRQGMTWDQLYRNVKFSEEVQGWTNFSQMKTLNIMGMYRWVSNHRRGNW